MKYYHVRCVGCSALFVGLEPKDDYICPDCVDGVRDAIQPAKGFVCPDCQQEFTMRRKHDANYRCEACVKRRRAKAVARQRATRENKLAEAYRIKMFGKNGGVE